MAARKFKMPSSLDESIAKSQPPVSEPERPSCENIRESFTFTPAQKEPLAQDGVEKKPGITFAAQDDLPRLPIPELESTLHKYRAVLEPLQTKKEQSDTAAAVQGFLKSEGAELQMRLKKYATGKTSFIEQFCES